MYDDWMNPGAKPMPMLNEDGIIDMQDSPRIEELDKAMDPIGGEGSQSHPAKKRQPREMDFLG
jgi:hypothetical protein